MSFIFGKPPKPVENTVLEDEGESLEEINKKRRAALFGTSGGQRGESVLSEGVGRRRSVLGN